MLLTHKEKQILLKLLKKEKRRKMFSRKEADEVSQLAEKMEQNVRNENMNDTSSSKL